MSAEHRPSLDRFLATSPTWAVQPGPQSSIVLSSRVRLARNLSMVPFPGRSSAEQRKGVVRRARSATAGAPGLTGAEYYPMDGLEPPELKFMLERRLVSRDLASGEPHRGVLVGRGESVSVMINEEDHLRLQGVLSGFRIGEALDLVGEIERQLDGQLDFAYSEKLGYLTACPTNVGTGMRASVLVHLPALHLGGETRKVMQGAAAMGLAVRGFHGEGSEMMGNFVQISNHVTLGVEDNEIVRQLGEKVHAIIRSEEQARESLWDSARLQVEDKIYRAYGLLAHARSMKGAEVLNLASAVRFGLTLELPGLCSAETLNEILVFTQPSHIALRAGGAPSKEERRRLRADYIRGRLAADVPAARRNGRAAD
jgi:protein arginine kinase